MTADILITAATYGLALALALGAMVVVMIPFLFVTSVILDWLMGWIFR